MNIMKPIINTIIHRARMGSAPLASLGLTLVCSATLHASELLLNGSFDNATSWQVIPPQSVAWTCIANGEAYLHPATGGYIGAIISQTILVNDASGRTVHFSAVMSKIGAPSGNTIVFKLEYLDTSDVKRELTILSPANDNISNLTPLSADVVLPAGVKSVRKFIVYKADFGAFTLQSVSLDLKPLPLAPEIAVEQPAGSNLVDGSTKTSFGTIVVGKTGTARNYIIRNTGTATLSGLAITKNGIHAGDFTVTALAKTSLFRGTATSFKVTFKPTAAGTRNAAIHIKSNDSNENPFDIKLTGQGALP